jgi:MFS transporter, UMF1 family
VREISQIVESAVALAATRGAGSRLRLWPPMPTPHPPADEGNARLFTLPVLSWSLYDLGNTIFSMNIVSFYFSVFLVGVLGAADSAYGYAAAFSYAIIFVLSPFLGALTDQAPRRMPFLIASTAICVGFTLLLGTTADLGLLLVFFVVANIAYQSGLQFYDALLPEVSTEATRGRVGGLGIGLGYTGSFIGLLTARWILGDVDAAPQGEQVARYGTVFTVTGLLFLLFAIPCFLFVRERVRASRQFGLGSFGAAGRQVLQTARSVRRFPGLARFLIGRVFYTDAVNTVITFMGIYVTREVGFTTAEAILVMLVATGFAVPGGYAWGHVVDRIGPKRTLNMVLGLWVVVFSWAALVGFLRLPAASFWPVSVLAGLALGGTWASDRPYMLRLTPPDRIGEFYGLYNMVGRFSAVTGPFTWAFISERVEVFGVGLGLGWGRPAAVTVLLCEIVIGFLILRKVSDARRQWGAGEDGAGQGRLEAES